MFFGGVGWDILVTYHAEIHTVLVIPQKKCAYINIYTQIMLLNIHIIRI